MNGNELIARLTAEGGRRLVSLCFLLLRLTIGPLLFVVGSGKLFGWFGGFGVDMAIQFYGGMGIPLWLTYVSCWTEFIGGFLVTLGLLTRPAAFAVTINMLVATLLTLPNGFLAPNGASSPFTFMIIALAILLAGSLAYGLDALLAGRLKHAAGKRRQFTARVVSSPLADQISTANG